MTFNNVNFLHHHAAADSLLHADGNLTACPLLFTWPLVAFPIAKSASAEVEATTFSRVLYKNRRSSYKNNNKTVNLKNILKWEQNKYYINFCFLVWKKKYFLDVGLKKKLSFWQFFGQYELKANDNPEIKLFS